MDDGIDHAPGIDTAGHSHDKEEDEENSQKLPAFRIGTRPDGTRGLGDYGHALSQD
jgi:hypothetical protein